MDDVESCVIVATAFLIMFNMLLPLVPDDDEEALQSIEKAVKHIKMFLNEKERLDIDMLMRTLNIIMERVRQAL